MGAGEGRGGEGRGGEDGRSAPLNRRSLDSIPGIWKLEVFNKVLQDSNL